MIYKEMSCLAIHDISGVGKCSLTVALPVLSCCGVETSVMPTAVLSTHTGGFEGYTYRDLTDDLLPMAEHWRKVGARFQSLYSGFLGSAGQIGLVEQVFDWFKGEDTLIMVDPVMGDGGKLYRTYTQEMADGMARLCQKADIVVPNMTEACHLLGRPYNPGPYTREEIRGDFAPAVRPGAEDGRAHRGMAQRGKPGYRLLRCPHRGGGALPHRPHRGVLPRHRGSVCLGAAGGAFEWGLFNGIL